MMSLVYLSRFKENGLITDSRGCFITLLEMYKHTEDLLFP